MPDVHLTVGGSTAERTMNCPAWQAWAKDMPKTLPSQAAIDGTAMHSAYEQCLDDTDPHELVGQTIETVKITPAHVRQKLIPAIGAWNQLLERYDVDLFDIECFVQVAEDTGGTMDMIARSRDGKTAIVADYKSGEGNLIDPRENPQCGAYAHWASQREEYDEFFENAETLALVIIQPNSQGKPVLDVWETPIEWLDEFGKELDQAIERSRTATKEDTGLLNTGKWCNYCPAAPVCPAQTGELDMVYIAKEEYTKDLGLWLDKCAVAERNIKAIRQFAHEQAEEGVRIEGWKLVNKQANRAWRDEDAAREIVRRSKKVKHEDAYTEKFFSPTQLEALYKEKGLDFKKFQEHIHAPSSGTTLVKASNKRPEVIPPRAVKRLAKQ